MLHVSANTILLLVKYVAVKARRQMGTLGPFIKFVKQLTTAEYGKIVVSSLGTKLIVFGVQLRLIIKAKPSSENRLTAEKTLARVMNNVFHCPAESFFLINV